MAHTGVAVEQSPMHMPAFPTQAGVVLGPCKCADCRQWLGQGPASRPCSCCSQQQASAPGMPQLFASHKQIRPGVSRL